MVPPLVTASRCAPGLARGNGSARAPAELMAQAGVAAGAPAEVARAHHGSVSRQERAEIEEALKAGRLPAVVATSSLELGIDMGAVGLVVQVEAPPSVASGLQRVGRAGHNVGDVSRGIIFPKYQGDLVQSAVVAERMRAGEIEELKIPHNPLDVLAQQIVAMTAVDDWLVDELEQTVRRAAPFGGLTRPVLDVRPDRAPGGRIVLIVAAAARRGVQFGHVLDRDDDLQFDALGAGRLHDGDRAGAAEVRRHLLDRPHRRGQPHPLSGAKPLPRVLGVLALCVLAPGVLVRCVLVRCVLVRCVLA